MIQTPGSAPQEIHLSSFPSGSSIISESASRYAGIAVETTQGVTPSPATDPIEDRLIWLDLETTSLDHGWPLECTIVITDSDLQAIDGVEVLIKPSLQVRVQDIPAIVWKMHDDSGLWGDCMTQGQSLGEAERALYFFVRDRGFELGKNPLCGSSVHYDRSVLEERMPTLFKVFSYRNIDVSSISELIMRWRPDIYALRPGANDPKAHRSSDDIRISIELLRYYREVGFSI